jgi:hypothetical protein
MLGLSYSFLNCKQQIWTRLNCKMCVGSYKHLNCSFDADLANNELFLHAMTDDGISCFYDSSFVRELPAGDQV